MKRGGRWVWHLLAALGLLFTIVSATPWVVESAGQALSGAWPAPRGEVMIVLGGGSLEDGTVGESSYWRAVYAVRVWRVHPFRKILFCGAATAPAMRNFAVALGVPADVIEIEVRSLSTRENGEEAKHWLDRQPARPAGILLLSSDYHMYRAARVFRRLGVPVVSYPISDARKRARSVLSRWPAFLDVMTELGKIGYYQARGWI